MGFRDFVNNLLSRDSGTGELPPPQDNPEAFLANLASALPEYLQWNTDEHAGGLVAVLEIDAADQVMAQLTQQLGEGWNRKNLGQAPPSVRHALKEYGGLRDKQRVFATGLTGEVMLLGLWWPWGHGGSVSIRFVPHGQDDSAAVESSRAALGTAFGIN